MAGVQVTVGGDAAQAYSVLDGVAAKAATTATKIADGFKTRIGQRLFDGLLSAAASLPNAMKSAIDAGGRLSDQMAQTGASGEGLVIMERWLTNAGMSAESTTKLLGIMQRSIAGLNEDMKPTGEAFAALGLNMEELRALDPTATFERIGKAIAAIDDPAQRTALAMRIFGRSGAEALVAFDDATGFESARAELGALPAVLAENAVAMDAVSDRMANMGTAWQQVGAAAAASILPALEEITASIASMDLTAVGQAIGAVLNALVALHPWILAAGAAMVALKIGSFIVSLSNKTRAWLAETAAIKANTAALRENAAAGTAANASKSAGGGNFMTKNRGLGMAMAGGGALAIAGIASQLAMNYANDLAADSAAMEAAFDRANAAMEKFEINAIRAQVSSREEIEATIAAIEAEKTAIQEAADAQLKSVDDPKTREKIISDTETTIKLLGLKAKQIRATSDEQLAATAAAKAASAAEAEHAAALEKSAESYKKAREAYEKSLLEESERGKKDGSLDEQIASLDAAEKKIREGMVGALNIMFPDADSATLASKITGDSPTAGKDMEQVNKLAALEKERASLLEKKAAEEQKASEARAEALADYDEELAILNAQISGSADKVKSLEREAEIRKEIASLASAGIKEDEAIGKAEAIVDARRGAEEASAQQALMESLGDPFRDAVAMIGGKEAQAKRAEEKRATELEAQGVDPAKAADIAANETSLGKITELKSQSERTGFESSFGKVSDMQRIGGGGGVVDSGVDLARQQADLQKQMVQHLAAIASRTPAQSLEF